MSMEVTLYREIEWKSVGGTMEITLYRIGFPFETTSITDIKEIVMHIGGTLIKVDSGSGRAVTARGLFVKRDPFDNTRLLVQEMGGFRIPI